MAKVGDFFYTDWGYDQTNIDFYQVTKVTDKTVTVRKVESRIFETDTTKYKRPEIGKFDGDPVTRKVIFHNDNVFVRLSKCEWAYLWDGKAKRFTDYA